MSVRMKLTHSKTASRRAHHRAGTPRLVTTPNGTRRRHFVDPATGMYRGKQIILKKVKKEELQETNTSVTTGEANKTIEAPTSK